MPIKSFVNQCAYCGKNFTAYRVTSRFCDGNCRTKYHRESAGMARGELHGFSDAEHEIALAIKTDSEVSYQLILTVKQKSVFNARVALWAVWTARYPDELPPLDIVEYATAILEHKLFKNLDKGLTK